MGCCDDTKKKTCQSRSLRAGFALCGLWAAVGLLEAVGIVALLDVVVVAWTPPGVFAFGAGLSGARTVPSSLLLRAAPLFGRFEFSCKQTSMHFMYKKQYD